MVGDFLGIAHAVDLAIHVRVRRGERLAVGVVIAIEPLGLEGQAGVHIGNHRHGARPPDGLNIAGIPIHDFHGVQLGVHRAAA